MQRGLMIFLEELQRRHNSGRYITGKEVDGKLYGVVETGGGAGVCVQVRSFAGNVVGGFTGDVRGRCPGRLGESHGFGWECCWSVERQERSVFK